MSSKQTEASQPHYHLRVENFGKLAEAEIGIGDFTVLAGPNNTGKSFISKLLYSIFSALDADLPRVRVSRLVSSYTRGMPLWEDELPNADLLRPIAEEMKQLALLYANGEIERLDEVVTRLNQEASKMEDVVNVTIRQFEGTSSPRTQRLLRNLLDLRESLEQLTLALAEAADRRAFSIAELQHRTRRALIMNFQVPDMVSLASDPDKEVVVDVAEWLQFVAFGDNVDLGENDAVPALPMWHQNVVYIESPLYWKLFGTLRGTKNFAWLNEPVDMARQRLFSPFGGREALTGVPDYFYDLAETIKRKYTGEMAFPEVHRQLVGSDVINGKVVVSESGETTFEEAGRSFPLATAAAGVANVGFLAMLIERKVIDHGTMLFIDEPEAHLHPAWQVVVAKALFQLAREGVRVVLATHSLDILKWLEVHLKENPDEEKYVALNHFPNPAFDQEDVATKLACIKDDLTKPFVDLYLRGL